MNMLRFLLLFLSIPTQLYAQQNNPAANTPAPQAASTATQPATSDPKTPEEFFARARQLSDLEATGIPFHLKATFAASGDTEFTGNGTIEEWWQSKDVWRKAATLGDYKWVQIKNGQSYVALASSTYTPLRVRQIMDLKIFHIGLPEGKMQRQWQLYQIAEGNSALMVVTLQKPCEPKYKKIICIQQYEFSENGLLQGYRNNDLSETYSDFQPYGKLIFPRKLSLMLRGNPLLEVDVSGLKPLSNTERDLFNAVSITGLYARPSPLIDDARAKGVTPPILIHHKDPEYPKSEHKHHPNRMVFVACTIDATGTVREPYVQLSGGTAFDQAAINSISQWKFRPAKHNGDPVMANLVILVDFRAW